MRFRFAAPRRPDIAEPSGPSPDPPAPPRPQRAAPPPRDTTEASGHREKLALSCPENGFILDAFPASTWPAAPGPSQPTGI